MSVEAISWVLNKAPDVPSQLVSTLIGIANHATPDGRNAYPSQPRLARYTRKSERQVRRDLAELAKRGLIRRGDQRIVEHLPQDRRPVVYDLAMDLDGGTPTSARSSTSARTPMSERGDTHVRGGGTPTSAKPSYEPLTTVSQSAQGSQAHRWLNTRYGGLTDRMSATVVREVRRRAPKPIDHIGRYFEAMAEGDLADIVAAVMNAEEARTRPPLQAVPDLPDPPARRQPPPPEPTENVIPAEQAIAKLRAEKGWGKTAP